MKFSESPGVVEALREATEGEPASSRPMQNVDEQTQAAATACDDRYTSAFFAHADATTVSRCLDEGENVGVRDETGATPLHAAAAKSRTAPVVEALLDEGANTGARDEAGGTPRDYIKENPALAGTAVAQRLTGVLCDDWNTARFFEHVGTATVSHCLNEGAEVGARDENEAIPLHFVASRNAEPTVVQVLLDAGRTRPPETATARCPGTLPGRTRR